MIMLTRFLAAVAAMALVVASSNVLVQYPVDARLFGIDLSGILTWGAFTYPLAFLVTDLTNRHFGPAAARRVVLVGFGIAVLLSIVLASPRIAIASGTAFLLAQTLDVTLYDRLRSGVWWQAPLVSSLLGSILDTALFFGLAFAPAFGWLDTGFGRPEASLGDLVPLFGIGGATPLWIGLALGDFCVKLLAALALLAPYRLLRDVIADRYAQQPAR